MRSEDRELFPVEQVHGSGIYNRLPIIPDLAVAKVREMGRFVRNTRPLAGREAVARAVVEVGVALFRLMAGPLGLSVDAVVGDLEEDVAKQNLDFFHVPCHVVHGTVPYASSASYLYPRYLLHTVYPFAFLTSDIEAALPRLEAVEHALAEPGVRGLAALIGLRSQGAASVSMLHPVQETDPLDELGRLHQPSTGMSERRALLELGEWLRQAPPFDGLSVAEAAMLCALMQRVEVPAGHVIARQGDTAEALYVIECGHASVALADRAADVDPVDILGPGHCIGGFGVLADLRHPVDVTAATGMTLLQLSKADHDTYLARLPDVDRWLSLDALRRLSDVDRHRRLHPTEHCGCGEACECQGHDHNADTTEPGSEK